MTDPEVDYRRLTSGDPGSVRSLADSMVSTAQSMDAARGGIYDASTTTRWTGPAATAFQGRVSALMNGVSVNRAAVARVRGALDTAAAAYSTAIHQADHYIAFWRNRPSFFDDGAAEELFARLVRARILEVGRDYNAQLAGILGVLTGKGVDLDQLDAQTRKWVQDGLAKNEDWTRNNDSDSGLGPLIPSTAAAGDDRGLIPQGLGYDARTGTLLQSYYDSHHHATLALVDQTTGTKIGEVRLGEGDPRPGATDVGAPQHAGGVAVDGDDVYVTDNGRLYTYSLHQIRAARTGGSVPQHVSSQHLDGGSYATVHNGRLYMGDFDKNKLYVYEKGPSGKWQHALNPDGSNTVVDTPDNTQGVVARDGQYIFSTSSGRDNGGHLVVQDVAGGDRRTYDLPNMSEGVIESDGSLLTSYESGAGHYSRDKDGNQDHDLWANPYMTRTPLSALGLGKDFELQLGTLGTASRALEHPADALGKVSSILHGTHLQAHLLGEVPAAADLASTLNQLADSTADSLRIGSRAVQQASEELSAAQRAYARTDQGSGHRFGHP